MSPLFVSSKELIVVTGAAGFIGSCLLSRLNEEGLEKLILVDDFSRTDKLANLKGKKFLKKVERDVFLQWFEQYHDYIGFVFHLGARTNTTETNLEILNALNLRYSQDVWKLCSKYHVPLVYASSAATYGAGEHGYNDDHEVVYILKPLNHYGASKNEFDKWVLEEVSKASLNPPKWAGLKFFNVYGPNEYHKGRMASVVYHAVKQICLSGSMNLFRSHRHDYEDGQQLRDFIYVKDVIDVLLFFYKCFPENGLYNVGTGKARTFQDLATITFEALGREPKIAFIDIPEDIREKYQYHTEAKIDKLRKAGYTKKMSSLEEGIEDYVKNYLKTESYL